MAIRFQIAVADDSVNLSPATGAVAMWNLIDALIHPSTGAGWTKVMDSDGTTYSSTGVQVTSGASGAGGLGNTKAWVRLQDPAGAKEIVICRGTTDLIWYIVWSHASKFVIGSPAAQVLPEAADQQLILGTGTAASPVGGNLFTTNGTYKVHIGYDTAAPYCFWLLAYVTGVAGVCRRFMFMPMASASYPSADAAPYIVEASSAAMTVAVMSGVTANSSCFGQGYYKYGLSGEAWTTFRSPTNTTISALPINPYDGNDQIVPIHVCRLATDSNGGWKGWIPTTVMGWTAVDQNNGYYFDVSGVRYAVYNDIAIRFPNSVVPT